MNEVRTCERCGLQGYSRDPCAPRSVDLGHRRQTLCSLCELEVLEA